MHAELIAIGDEIVSGQLLDTNTPWLSLRLEELGIPVLYHTAVGDDLDAMVEVLGRAVERSGLVVSTGGLGPTADDLTRQALARLTGRKLVMFPEALEHIRALFARRGRPMPEQNQVQAFFPEGARMIPNPEGTAPGIDVEVPRPGAPSCRLLALPGVPAEMQEMWHRTVVGALRGLGAGRGCIRHWRVKCFGVGESQMEAMLPDLIRRGRQPRVGINASQGTIIFRITAQGETPESARSAMEPTLTTLRQCLGTLIFGEEDDELQHVVVRLLREQRKTLATVECDTAGLVAHWLADVPESRTCYRGGLVLGGQRPQQPLLRLPFLTRPTTSQEAAQQAAAMAEACREEFGSDYGLAIGPFPEPEVASHDPPLVWMALAAPEGTSSRSFPWGGHPAMRKALFAKHALNLLRLTLLEKGLEGRGTSG